MTAPLPTKDISQPCPCQRPATYTIAGRSLPVVVLGFVGEDEVRILDKDGNLRTVRQERVRLERAS